MPQVPDYPEELKSYLGRKIDSCTFQDLIRGRFMPPFYVKPKRDHKLFAGILISTLDDLDFLPKMNPLTPLYVSECLKFKSEWRAMVLRGQILNISCYMGDSLIFPNPSTIKSAIKEYKSAPIGYAIDWAVTDNGATLLMEVNDGFALGNYGCRGHYYLAVIEARWRELMGLEDRTSETKSLSL
jgi:ATP-grasp domain, R2K clade family 2